MTTFYMLGSLLLGILAWIFACAAVIRKARRLLLPSFALCAAALLLQLLEVKHLADDGDFSAIADTIHAVVLASCVLVGVTAVLNAAAIIQARRKQ